MLKFLVFFSALFTTFPAFAAGSIFGPSNGSGVTVATQAATGYSAFTTTQGTATLADTSAGISLSDTTQGGFDVIRAVCKTPPATPYSAIYQLYWNADDLPNNSAGVGWRDSGSGKLVVYGWLGINAGVVAVPSVISSSFNNPTGFNTANGHSGWSDHHVYLKLVDDGTNAIQEFSKDGVNWATTFSVAKAAGFLGATGYNQICFFVDANNVASDIVLYTYKETSP